MAIVLYFPNFAVIFQRKYGEVQVESGGDCLSLVSDEWSAGQICMVTFQVNGCIHTVACANAVVQLVEGRSVVDSWELVPENMINYPESLPEDHHHCAELVVGSFYLALNDCHRVRREPWRKGYPGR